MWFLYIGKQRVPYTFRFCKDSINGVFDGFFCELCFTGWIQRHPGLITPLLRFMWTFLFSSPQGRWFVLTNWIKISSINSISGEWSKEDAKNEDHWPYGVFRLQSGAQGAGPRHWPHHSYSQTNKKSAREDRQRHEGRKVGGVAIANNKNTGWLPLLLMCSSAVCASGGGVNPAAAAAVPRSNYRLTVWSCTSKRRPCPIYLSSDKDQAARHLSCKLFLRQARSMFVTWFLKSHH